MKHLNIAKLRNTPRLDDPYQHVIVPNFINAQSIKLINQTFPDIQGGGSYPVDNLDRGSALRELIDELDSKDFEDAISEKFKIQLSSRPKMYSLRGHTRHKDGVIHTDSKDKIITVLVYLNEVWNDKGGRLRVLRNGTELENYTSEVSPDGGNLLVFVRSENSWHGHLPYDGPRRSLQMNWMADESKLGLHALRHKISSFFKARAA